MMLLTDIPRGWRAECHDGDASLIRTVGIWDLSISVPADDGAPWEWWVTHRDKIAASKMGGSETMTGAIVDAVDALCRVLGGAE